MTISNYHNTCPLSCIINTLHIQNIFFKETTYTKVHFYVKDIKGLNKPVTPMGINKYCHIQDIKNWPYSIRCIDQIKKYLENIKRYLK